MSTQVIEQELAELKKRVEKLEAKTESKPNQRWREAFGMMPDDEISREAERLGAEWRAQANREGR